MDIDERKQKILELISQKGKVKVNELSELFGISEVTVRIDLADLDAKGLLSRVHGGAVGSYKEYYNMNLKQRLEENKQQKGVISENIAAMVKNNDTVIFNSGTTTLMVFRMLPRNMSLSIVTNSVDIALEGSENPNFNVVLLGGYVNTKYRFTYGDNAENQLKNFYADKLILSVDGISPDGVLSSYYNQEAALVRHMLERADISIIAADYTKIGRTAFAKIAMLAPEDTVVTNKTAPEDDISSLLSVTNNIVLV